MECRHLFCKKSYQTPSARNKHEKNSKLEEHSSCNSQNCPACSEWIQKGKFKENLICSKPLMTKQTQKSKKTSSFFVVEQTKCRHLDCQEIFKY